MNKILVVGSFMMDLVARTPRAPQEGETIKGNSFGQFTGGKGANQAVSAARLCGGNVTMLGKVGEDSFGNAQIESLKKSGICTDYIIKDGRASTGVGFITVEETGKNRIIIISGANLLFTPEELENNKKMVEESDIVILQFEIPMETNYKAIDLAYEYGKAVILNPAPSAKFDTSYFKKVTYFIPNEHEAKDFTGITITDINSARESASKLLAMGCKNVLITMGDKGVFFLNEKEEYFVESHKVKAVDTTAAGDEFIGAFAYGICSGFGHEKAIKFANIAAAISVTRMGAQPSLPTLKEVQEFIAKNNIAI